MISSPVREFNYSLVVLAGGQGRRMGGSDKGLMKWRDSRMIEHILALHGDKADEVLISCNRNKEHYAVYGSVVEDYLPDYAGPLSGVASALSVAKNDWLAVLPCDCPTPPQHLFDTLHHAACTESATVSFVHDGNREQYLFALIHRDTFANLEAFLVSGNLSVQKWYESVGAQAVDFSSETRLFSNFNTPDDLV